MKIGILGTGMVARSVGGKWASLRHDVVFGTRDVSATLARTKPDGYGNPPFTEWEKQYPNAALGTFAHAAAHGEIVVNATSGSASLKALVAAGKENLRGKVLLDISNPLDFSKGFPPSLTVCNTDSLGEQIQRAFPEAKVVKTLNTVNANVMTHPDLIPGDHTLFLSGNDVEAKQKVTEILSNDFGWKASNIIDLGDLTSARATEMILPLWVRLFSLYKNPLVSLHVVVGSPAGM